MTKETSIFVLHNAFFPARACRALATKRRLITNTKYNHTRFFFMSNNTN